MQKSPLPVLARQHLDLAQEESAGRSSETLYGGQEHDLRQTLIALAAGRELNEHENPGEATVQVLAGRVRVVAADTTLEGSTGDLLVMPQSRHRLEALETSAILLTVAKHY